MGDLFQEAVAIYIEFIKSKGENKKKNANTFFLDFYVSFVNDILWVTIRSNQCFSGIFFIIGLINEKGDQIIANRKFY